MQKNIAKTAKGLIEYRLEGSGPVVVVLNGGQCSRDSRLSHEQLAEPGFSALTASRPGYDSTPYEVGRSAQEATGPLAALLDTLHIQIVDRTKKTVALPTAYRPFPHAPQCEAVPKRRVDRRVELSIECVEILLLIAAIVAMVAGCLKIPYTVVLVIAGIVLAIFPLSPDITIISCQNL
jgi:hypothetical protein